MVDKTQHIANIFKSIGHPIRIQIIRIIYEKQRLSVTDIQKQLDISQPVISLHLAILKRKEIIGSEKKGKNNFYFIKNNTISQVINIVYYDTNLE